MSELYNYREFSITKMDNKKKLKSSVRSDQYTILYTLKPFHTILSIIGLGKFNQKGNNIYPIGLKSKIYSLLWSLSVIVIGSVCVLIGVIRDSKLSEIVLGIYTTATVFSILSLALGMFKTAFNSSALINKLTLNVMDLDKKLNVHNKSIYIKSRIYILLLVAFSTAISGLRMVYEDYCTDSEGLVRILEQVENLIDYLCTLQFVEFSVFLWINITRMKIMNENLKEILNDVTRINEESRPHEQIEKPNPEIFTVMDEGDKNRIAPFKIKQISDRILYVMKVFDVIADNVQIINECYGLLLLLMSTTTFLNIMSTVNGLISFDALFANNKNMNMFIVFSWCMPMTVFLVIAAYVAEMLRNEIEDTSVIIDKLTINPIINADHLELLECFSQMLTGRKVYVTANNFFSFDSSFIFSLVGTVATYTVILMQVNTSVPTSIGQNVTNSSNSTAPSY